MSIRRLPVRTNKVETPPPFPNAMSVSIRSPIITVLAGSKCCLKGLNSHLAAFVSRSQAKGQRGRSETHLALMQSSIALCGLPTAIGSILVAYRSGALIAPAPGSVPPPGPAGYVESSFVAMNRQPGLRVRYWNALESLVYVTLVSSPARTIVTFGSRTNSDRANGGESRQSSGSYDGTEPA